MDESDRLVEVGPAEWELPVHDAMRVPGRIFADRETIEQLRQEEAGGVPVERRPAGQARRIASRHRLGGDRASRCPSRVRVPDRRRRGVRSCGGRGGGRRRRLRHQLRRPRPAHAAACAPMSRRRSSGSAKTSSGPCPPGSARRAACGCRSPRSIASSRRELPTSCVGAMVQLGTSSTSKRAAASEARTRAPSARWRSNGSSSRSARSGRATTTSRCSASTASSMTRGGGRVRSVRRPGRRRHSHRIARSRPPDRPGLPEGAWSSRGSLRDPRFLTRRWCVRRSAARRASGTSPLVAAGANCAFANRQMIAHLVRVSLGPKLRTRCARGRDGLRHRAQQREDRGARCRAGATDAARPPQGSNARVRLGTIRGSAALPWCRPPDLRRRHDGDGLVRASGDGGWDVAGLRQRHPWGRPSAVAQEGGEEVLGRGRDRRRCVARGIRVWAHNARGAAEEAPGAYKDVEARRRRGARRRPEPVVARLSRSPSSRGSRGLA